MARSSKEYKSFEQLTDRLLSVPRETVAKRMTEYKEQAAKNPNKRGPKPKTSASRDAS